MGEGDSIQLGPGGEDPLLGDEAVVVALAAVLILDVGDTLVWPLGLIVVVGHALEAGPLAGAERMGAVRAGDAPAGPLRFPAPDLLAGFRGGNPCPSRGLDFPICEMDVGWTRFMTTQLCWFFKNMIEAFLFLKRVVV